MTAPFDGTPFDGTSFEDLVTAATVGVSRKPLTITELDGPAAGHTGVLDVSDPAAAVLDAAALLTTARRAGFRPEPGLVSPLVVPGEARPELSAVAERVLRQIGRAHQAPGFAAADSELLADLLTAASDAGYRAPAPLLPDLLDAAVRTAALRPAVAAVLGGRGRWLAGHRPDWQRVADLAVTATSDDPVPSGDPGIPNDPEAWRTGSRADRHAYLTGLRDRDPMAARELLTADWARATGDERAALLPALARGLSPDDEEFLDAALDDRAAAVRVAARRLLTRLPDARFTRRATERARAALQLERRGPRRRLVVSLPGDPDAAAARDGIDARRPSPSIGAGAWRLTQVIASVPLTSWTTMLQLSPEEIVALPVGANLAIDVHAGLRLAAVSQGNSQWASALLAAGDPDDGGNRPPAAWPADQRLAAILPPPMRAARTAALLVGTNQNGRPEAVHRVIAEVAGCPVPWPAALADAVLTVLGRAASLPVLPRLPRGLLDAAARGLPATSLPATGGRDYAAELSRLADAHPQTWSPLLRATTDTILLRRAFLEEIR
jgi:Family of unknown function (DUF5691)